MNYSITLLEDPSVLMIRIAEDFSKADFEAHIKDVRAVFATLENPLYQIVDVRSVNLGFDDVMAFLHMSVRSEESITPHPMNLGNLIVTKNRFYQLVIQGLSKATFGAVRIQVFEAVDEALEWVRAQED